MSVILDSLLCVFLIICFNEETQIDENIICPDYCECFNGGNVNSLSIVCNNFSNSLSRDLTNLSNNLHLNTLAFVNINDDSFPNNLFDLISFENLITRDCNITHIQSISDNITNQFNKVSNKDQTKALTFISSDISEWNWATDLNMFTNIKVIYIEDCNLPEVLNFRNWSQNSLISLSLINSGIRSIHEQELDHWPYLRMVSLSQNSIRLLNRNWFAPTLSNLWSLDLSYNKIICLTPDFFGGMPALRKLRLDNNLLISLPFDSIESIWENTVLNEFFIESNNIECGRRNDLCWIAIQQKFPNFFSNGECRLSNSSEVKYFYSLKVEEVCPERNYLN